MNNMVVQLLPNYEINFFDNDPSQFTKRIKNFIEKY